MTSEAFKSAKRLEFNIQRLEIFIKDVEKMEHYCQGFDIHENPETTAEVKRLLLTDLRQRLAEQRAEFAAL